MKSIDINKYLFDHEIVIPGVMMVLLNAGADVNVRDKFGGTTVMLAGLYQNYELTKALLDRGVDINAKDIFGNTALTRAVKDNNVSMIELYTDPGFMSKYGIDLNIRGVGDYTALMLVSHCRDGSIYRMLQNANAR